MRCMQQLRPWLVDGPVTLEPTHLGAGFTKFTVHVVFTTWPGTLAALRMAAQRPYLFEPRIIVWFFQQVPRQFSAVLPPVSTDFLKRRLRAMARKCCSGVETEIRICLCTNERECMRAALPPENVVLAGGRKRWWPWPSRERRIAAFLKTCGCRVLFVATDRTIAISY